MDTKADYREHLDRVRKYHERLESRWGYALLLGGRKHLGYYPPGRRTGRIEAMELMEEQIAERLCLPPGSRVLDAGSGVGIVASNLAKRYGWNVVGIDLLARNPLLSKANAAAGGAADRTEFIQADYLSLCFSAESFDGAYTCETLVHSPAPEATLAELHRVLKPGGRLVCAEYTVASSADQGVDESRLREAYVVMERVACLPSFVNGMAAHLHGAGFADVREDDLTERVLPMVRMFHRLGRIPYWLARRLRLTHHLVNTQLGVEMYRCQGMWGYVMASATKESADV